MMYGQNKFHYYHQTVYVLLETMYKTKGLTIVDSS